MAKRIARAVSLPAWARFGSSPKLVLTVVLVTVAFIGGYAELCHNLGR